jgi:ParB-like chromosome segregation protein Spo0J
VSEVVNMAFERQIVTLPIAQILPLRQVDAAVKRTAKYQRIVASIDEVDIIEPLVVARASESDGTWLLLDGHLRLAVLLDRGIEEARCLIADDDETFTYNKRINRLALIQEHFMIVRALERGVPTEKLARALDISLDQIRRRRTMLDGINADVVELLKDRNINPATFDVLRKMKPLRQIEVADLMNSVGNFTSSYAKALLAATRQPELAKPERPKRIGGISPTQMARMEREMETLQHDFKAIESNYGDEFLDLVIIVRFIGRLIENEKIARHLELHHPEVFKEFGIIVQAVSLDEPAAA